MEKKNKLRLDKKLDDNNNNKMKKKKKTSISSFIKIHRPVFLVFI